MEKWSEKDILYLKLAYENMDLPVEHICFTLGRSRASVTWKAGKLNLNRKVLRKRKSKKEYNRTYKENNRKRIRLRINERREIFKLELISLLGGKCVKCGENRHMCLDFHHKNSKDKLFNIGIGLNSRSKVDMIKEAKKCILLCSNCHRELHFNLKTCNSVD